MPMKHSKSTANSREVRQALDGIAGRIRAIRESQEVLVPRLEREGDFFSLGSHPAIARDLSSASPQENNTGLTTRITHHVERVRALIAGNPNIGNLKEGEIDELLQLADRLKRALQSAHLVSHVAKGQTKICEKSEETSQEENTGDIKEEA